jgi:hypothetical protein
VGSGLDLDRRKAKFGLVSRPTASNDGGLRLEFYPLSPSSSSPLHVPKTQEFELFLRVHQYGWINNAPFAFLTSLPLWLPAQSLNLFRFASPQFIRAVLLFLGCVYL